MKHQSDEKKHVGSKEYISFPQLELTKVVARIDTGAKTSSIHCEKVWVERRNKNKKILCATLLRKSAYVTKFTDFKLKKVKSSNGHVQNRYIVKLRVNFAGDEFFAEFNLNNRDLMKHPVLIGRKFLKGRYLVDVGYMYIHSKKKKSTLDF